MKLIVNGHANIGTSYGTRRYMNGVLNNLHWPDAVETSVVKRSSGMRRRLEDHFQPGTKDALFWTPLHRGPLFAHNHVVTVLDCINIEYPPRGKLALPLVWALFAKLLSNARAIVPISKATEAAILRNFPVDASKIRTIAGPATIDGKALVDAPVAGTSKDGRPFILIVTNSLPHKNTAAACEAFAASAACKAGILLRIVGSIDERTRAALAAPGVLSEVRQGVDDSTLADWYQSCLFLLSPSLAEGLNLPIGEALSRGSNVLCSDIDVHREFYDGQVRFFDPLRTDAMVAAIDAAVGSEGRWPRHPNAAFRRSFSEVGSEYRALFQEIAAERGHR